MTIIDKKFSPEKYEVTFQVERDHDNMRLDQYLQLYFDTWSRQMIKKKIDAKEIEIIDRPGRVKPSSKIHTNDKIYFVSHKGEHEDEIWNGQTIEIQTVPDILFEDENIYVISKPAFMSTHPTGKHLFNCATVYLETLNNRTVHSIHRLDRETSGVLLLGKNPKTANQLTVEFEEDRVKKCYFFIAKKNEQYKGLETFVEEVRLGPAGEGLKRVYIDHHPKDSNKGKHAKTFFKILKEESGYVFGLAFPQTGRQHQIRVHAMVNGLPLVGDKLYLGSYEMFQSFKDNWASPEDYAFMELPRHALHSIGLNINYQNEKRIFVDHIPKDFKDWIESKNFNLKINELEKLIESNVKDYFEGNLKLP